MAKTYKYYGIAFDDIEVAPTGGVHIRPQCFQRKPHAVSTDPKALWNKAIESRSDNGTGITSCGVTYNDPVNDCTYVIWGHHYFEDIGVFKPCLPDEYSRSEHTKYAVIPSRVSCLT